VTSSGAAVLHNLMNPKAQIPLTMIDPDNYIVVGDRIIAVPKTLKEASVQGTVRQINEQTAGRREFVIEATADDQSQGRLITVSENLVLFEVQRGDSWVVVPSFPLIEEAEAKVARSVVNTAKRIKAKAPLFADYIKVKSPDAHDIVAQTLLARRETLLREHEAAAHSTDLRGQVQSLVTIEQFAALVKARSRFPRNSMYGIGFWKGQLRHIHKTGGPDIYVPTAVLNPPLNIDWLKVDEQVVWMSPTGPKNVRVLFIGSRDVMLKIIGVPIADYKPREFPFGNCWVCWEELRPLVAIADQNANRPDDSLPNTSTISAP
jgi:hypothetical protein